MKITVTARLTQEQENLVRNATANANLIGKGIGIPSNFSGLRTNQIPKDVFEFIVIPFDEIYANKKGLLRYETKYKPPYSFAPSEFFFDSGFIFGSLDNERGFDNVTAHIRFHQKPKVFLIHIGLCNQKFVIVMAHKDYIDASNLPTALRPGASFDFITPANPFPYPVNVDWHGLPGSWEYHQASLAGKKPTEPFLYNLFPCKINITDENEEYEAVAYLHDYEKSRDIITAPNCA